MSAAAEDSDGPAAAGFFDGRRNRPRFAAHWPEPRAPYCLPGIDPALQDDAFAFLLADQYRLQQACQMLTLLPGGEDNAAADMARALLLFFAADWLWQQEDFDGRLATLLRQRLLIGDSLEPLLDEMARQHRDDRERYLPLCAGLLELAEGAPLEEVPFIGHRNWFIETQARQMNVKRLCILPLARERLTSNDRDRLLHDMVSARMTMSASGE